MCGLLKEFGCSVKFNKFKWNMETVYGGFVDKPTEFHGDMMKSHENQKNAFESFR